MLAETVSNAVVKANQEHGYSHVVCAGTKFGANYLGRVGALLGVSPVSDVVEVISQGEYSLCGVDFACIVFCISSNVDSWFYWSVCSIVNFDG